MMTKQIERVEHTTTGTGPADFTLALEIAGALHAPVPRAPEVAGAARLTAGRRTTAARTRRRTVRG
jgi:hypothetical protein